MTIDSLILQWISVKSQNFHKIHIMGRIMCLKLVARPNLSVNFLHER